MPQRSSEGIDGLTQPMEIFNIHIFEFVLIAGLALVIFGPERLPEVGRFVGKQLAKLLAWQQQSPELQMLSDVRQEFEREIASLRDELVRTRSQFDITRDLSALKEELRPMLDLRGEFNTNSILGERNAAQPQIVATDGTPLASTTQGESVPLEPPDLVAPDGTALVQTPAASPEADQALADSGAPEPPTPVPTMPAQTVPASSRPNKLVAAEPTSVLKPTAPLRDETLAPEQHAALPSIDAAGPAGESADRQLLLRHLQMLMADVQALVIELQERGHLGDDWQPPSHMREETLSR